MNVLPSSTSVPSNKYTAAICGLVAVAVVGLYNLLFFTHYFPPSEGWFTVYGQMILNGLVPYRDFDLCLPPLYPWLMALFIGIFGTKIIFLRIAGLLLFIMMTFLLYRIYCRLFSPTVSALIAIGAIVYYQSNVAHICYDFLHILTFLVLLGTYLTIRIAELPPVVKNEKFSNLVFSLLCFGVGACAAFAFLIKQSNGLFVAMALFLGVYLTVHYVHAKLRIVSIFYFTTGAAIPALILILYLVCNSAFKNFWNQVFVGASQSKGSLTAILLGWVPRLFTGENILATVVIITIIAALGYFNFLLRASTRAKEQKPVDRFSKFSSIGILVAILPIIAIIMRTYHHGHLMMLLGNSFHLTKLYQYLVIWIFILSVVLMFYYMAINRSLSATRTIYIICGCASLGMLAGTTTSAAMGEAGGIIGFGLLFGMLLSGSSFLNIGKCLTYILLVALIGHFSAAKFITPYYWWSIHENPVHLEKFDSKNQVLAGLRISKDTRDAIDGTCDDISAHYDRHDTLFTFPNIPIFHTLTGIAPSSRHVVLWFDVASDKAAEDTARELISSPPTYIVWLELPENVWSSHEYLFRNGLPCGQRKIQAAVASLTDNVTQYVLDCNFPLNDNCHLKVWRRLTHSK